MSRPYLKSNLLKVLMYNSARVTANSSSHPIYAFLCFITDESMGCSRKEMCCSAVGAHRKREMYVSSSN